VGQPTKQLVTAVVVNNRFDNNAPKRRHSRDEPRRYKSTVKRKVSTARSIGHRVSIGYFIAAREAAITAFVNRSNTGTCRRVCCQNNGTDSCFSGTSSTSVPS
jgi:hypothetical protein